MINARTILLLLLLGINIPHGIAQDRRKLEQQRKKLEADIEQGKIYLQKIDNDKQKSLTQIELLSSQIETRQKVISNINYDLKLINENIRGLESVVNSLEKDLVELKQQYARMLYYAYRNRSSMNEMVFLLSANSFNDAINRLKYLQQYSQFRKHQADLIVQTKTDLNNRLAELEDRRQEQQQLLVKEVDHRKQLDAEKNEKDELVDKLQQKEKLLLKDIKKKQEQVNAVNKQIEDIIKREIAAAKEKERKERERLEKERKNNASSTNPKPSPVKPTPSTDVKLSNRFAENKGKLPWPVAGGVITSGFGQHPHPAIPNLMIDNKGIDIRTDENAKVHVVFDGDVISVRSVPGFDNVVIVKHGEYFTVYYKLKTVNTKTGDRLTTKQDIGTASGEMHFELWQDMVKLNPAVWLYGQ